MITAAWLRSVYEKSPGISAEDLVRVAECKERNEKPETEEKPKRARRKRVKGEKE